METWIIVFIAIGILIFAWYVHDKYVQRTHQILVNYPIIGRLRFVFQEFREPFRQYFGDEKFYESMDKLDWGLQRFKGQTKLLFFFSFSTLT